LEPDGRRLALTVRELDRSELWVSEIDRGNLSRLTYEGDSIEPVWSPDGQWIAFAWARGGRHQIFRVMADGRVGNGRSRRGVVRCLPGRPTAVASSTAAGSRSWRWS
jgi:dipeptidyl aminopeptidase/acylaminoacyl peptidase